jgi:hypothetical protein
MSETILGFPGLTEQGKRIVRDPVRGLSYEILYEGPKDAVVAAYITIASNVYVECDTLRPGPTGTLFLRTPDFGDNSSSDTVQTSYDLLPNIAQRSAYENPRCNLDEEEIRSIQDAIRKRTAPTGLSATGETLYSYMLQGHDTFFTSEIVFRVTDVINNGREHTRAYSYTNRIYSTEEVKVETGIANNGFYHLGLLAAEATVLSDVYGGSIPTGLVLGWLKQFPGTVNVPGNRSAVTVEYWLGAWPTLYYLQR